jgi:hypothetical protein
MQLMRNSGEILNLMEQYFNLMTLNVSVGFFQWISKMFGEDALTTAYDAAAYTVSNGSGRPVRFLMHKSAAHCHSSFFRS